MKKNNILKTAVLALPLTAGLVILFVLVLGMYMLAFINETVGIGETLISLLAEILILVFFIAYPAILSLGNVLFMVTGKNKFKVLNAKEFAIYTLILGPFFQLLYMGLFTEAEIFGDWSEQLYNRQVHAIMWDHAAPTVVTFMVVSLVGYVVLLFTDASKVPPLITVMSMAAMYLGMFVCVMLIVQFTCKNFDPVLYVLPINYILLCMGRIHVKIKEWKILTEDQSKDSYFKNLVSNSIMLPVVALIIMLPLLGFIVMGLMLFGQEPDNIIRAFTETSDWALSQRVGPQNAYYDEHYLCTVAAGGHEKVVKPIRMGQRHDHRVIVNRQLCVANAFEQVLEERTPRFHKAVRNFYDTYGFPISKLIKKKWQADLVYFIMKPLEWIFLIVLYLTDVKPENRIAVQYLPRE